MLVPLLLVQARPAGAQDDCQGLEACQCEDGGCEVCCPANDICKDNVCSPRECAERKDCKAGFFCDRYRCKMLPAPLPCITESCIPNPMDMPGTVQPCGCDEICSDKTCVPQECTEDVHCGANYRCNNHRCETNCPQGVVCGCTSNAECRADADAGVPAGLVCSSLGVCQLPVRAGPALEATCGIAGGQGTASRGPLAALLLAGIALGARYQRRSLPAVR